METKRLESGINELADDQIISRQSFKDAINEVSKQRLEQTIYAEFSDIKEQIELLRGDKAEHGIDTLMSKWNLDKESTLKVAKRLISIGFFEQKGDIASSRFKIPFMYRPYLEITQGSATSEIDE